MNRWIVYVFETKHYAQRNNKNKFKEHLKRPLPVMIRATKSANELSSSPTHFQHYLFTAMTHKQPVSSIPTRESIVTCPLDLVLSLYYRSSRFL